MAFNPAHLQAWTVNYIVPMAQINAFLGYRFPTPTAETKKARRSRLQREIRLIKKGGFPTEIDWDPRGKVPGMRGD